MVLVVRVPFAQIAGRTTLSLNAASTRSAGVVATVLCNLGACRFLSLWASPSSADGLQSGMDSPVFGNQLYVGAVVSASDSLFPPPTKSVAGITPSLVPVTGAQYIGAAWTNLPSLCRKATFVTDWIADGAHKLEVARPQQMIPGSFDVRSPDSRSRGSMAMTCMPRTELLAFASGPPILVQRVQQVQLCGLICGVQLKSTGTSKRLRFFHLSQSRSYLGWARQVSSSFSRMTDGGFCI